MQKRIIGEKGVNLGNSSDSGKLQLNYLDYLQIPPFYSTKSNKKNQEDPNIRRGREIFKNNNIFKNHVPNKIRHRSYHRNASDPEGETSEESEGNRRRKSKRNLCKRRGRSTNYRSSNLKGEKVVLLYSNNQADFFRERSRESLPIQKRTIIDKREKIINIFTEKKYDNVMAHRRKRSQEDEMVDEGAFPFQATPSGNFKIKSQQVVFESEKLSVLVADPQHTKVNIQPETTSASGQSSSSSIMMNKNDMNRRNQCKILPKSVMESVGPLGGYLGSFIASTTPVRKEKESPEYEGKNTNDILDPELNLTRLGYSPGEHIDWGDVKLPDKTNLYLELYQRITNYTNADCIVYIDNEEFNCHLIVLQCYSQVFDSYVAVKKVELPSDKVSPGAFAFIYEWMLSGEPSYKELNRENVLETFNAAKYLKIKDLMEQCWAFIDNTEVFAEDTAYLLYADAKDRNLQDVMELMLPRIQKFFLMLVSSQDWLDLEKEDVKSFLNSNYISVNCEMEVFMSAVRWLRHDWENRSDDIIEIMECVRFGNIAPWQLIDIKRNPENPEFITLAQLPRICKMIDDGLAFVIIKYWYGQENEDFLHWNRMLGLKEPPPRNWSGHDKTYFTYREFLIYLDQYRRNQMLEKSKTKPSKKTFIVDKKPNQNKSPNRIPPAVPTMDEFLTNRKTSLMEMQPVYKNLLPPNHPKRSTRVNPWEEIKYKIYHGDYVEKLKAAIKIQAAFRGYLVRKNMKKYLAKRYKNAKTIKKVSSAKTYSNNRCDQIKKNPSLHVLEKFNNFKSRIKSNIREKISSLFIPDKEAVLVFGGIDPHKTFGEGRNQGKGIFRYIPDRNIWEHVGDLPEPRYHHGAVFLKGKVYVCGGADPRDDDSRGKPIVVDTVWSFEPETRTWSKESSLSVARKCFGLVVANHSIYAIGGQDKEGKILSLVERFRPEIGKWEELAPMNLPRMGVGCTKFKDFIWVAGGMANVKRKPYTSIVECYDIQRDQWTEITKLRFPRCFSRLFSTNNQMYVIGGAGKLSEKNKAGSIPTMDVFDGERMEWKHLTDLSIARHGHDVAYLGTQIFIIGGITTVYTRALSNVECYCCQRGVWIRGISCLPIPLSGHAAVTLPPTSLM